MTSPITPEALAKLDQYADACSPFFDMSLRLEDYWRVRALMGSLAAEIDHLAAENAELRVKLEAGKIQWAAIKENADRACAENALYRDVAEAVKAMRENVSEWGPDALGQMHHHWFVVAPCQYGEAVDDALTALHAFQSKGSEP